MSIDNPCDHAEEIRELKRQIRELATHSGLGNSSITSGPGLQVGTPEGIGVRPGGSIGAGDVKIGNVDGNGSVKAGTSEFTKDSVGSGGTKIGADGKISGTGGKVGVSGDLEASGSATVIGHVQGGSIGAGGTKIGATGKISNDSNKLIVSSNTEFAGNVEAAGTSKATVVEGTGAVKSGGYVEAGGTQIRANGSIWNASNDLKVASNTDFAGNATAAGTMKASVVEATGTLYSPWRGGKQSVESLAEDIQANALQGISEARAAQSTANSKASVSSVNTAQNRADSAWNLANGKASVSSVTTAQQLAQDAYNDARKIASIYNSHMDTYHAGGPRINL